MREEVCAANMRGRPLPTTAPFLLCGIDAGPSELRPAHMWLSRWLDPRTRLRLRTCTLERSVEPTVWLDGKTCA